MNRRGFFGSLGAGAAALAGPASFAAPLPPLYVIRMPPVPPDVRKRVRELCLRLDADVLLLPADTELFFEGVEL